MNFSAVGGTHQHLEELFSTHATHQNYVNFSAVGGTHQRLEELVSTHATYQHNKIPPPYFYYNLLSTLPLIPIIHNHKHQLELFQHTPNHMPLKFLISSTFVGALGSKSFSIPDGYIQHTTAETTTE
jgi:hypothetical protein